MASLRQVKFQQARDYILAHPDESKEEQTLGAKVSVSMIALARASLIKDGLLKPSRRGRPPALAARPEPPSEGAPPEQPTKPAKMLDDAAMRAIADMAALDDDSIDDAEVHKRLLKQCIRFAFSPDLHPDTRMSASTMWAKLKDLQKARDLGPGRPMTYEDAVTRLCDLMRACGPEITLAAVNTAFDVKEPDEGQVPPLPPETARDTPGIAPAPGSTTEIPPHDGPAGPIELA